MGAAAVDLLVGQLQRQERGVPAFPKAVLVEGEWMDGELVPDRRGDDEEVES